jgi:hypothetical protein
MFCPRCGHQQSSDKLRFCSGCGLPMDEVSDALAVSDLSVNREAKLQREKHEVMGITLIFVGLLVSLVYLIVFGVMALVKNSDQSLIKLWITFLSIALILGGAGIFNLIRSGFFTRLDQRLNRVLERTKKRQRAQQVPDTGKIIEEKNILHVPAVPSVTEVTTRNLAEESRIHNRAAEKQ